MTDAPVQMDGKLLDVQNLKKHFPIIKGVLGRQVGTVRAVDGVSFFVRDGETLGVVNTSRLPKSKLKALHRNIQLIFQDPYSSLNPRWTLLQIVGEPLVVHG